MPALHRQSALLVADAPGHIIDRIGRSWLRHGQAVEHELVNSGRSSSYSICSRARQLGIVHWLDQIAYQALGKAVRAPQVAMVHHLTAERLQEGIASLDYCDAITTTSKVWQSKLEKLTGRPVVRIPYSIDTKTFSPSPDRERARAAAGISQGEFVLGFLGKAGANQDNRKGIDVLETTLQNAARQWNNLCLVLVGPGWDSLANRIRQAGVNVVQRQYDTTEETAAAYALMDVLLVTSSEEGGPCTILEAMACGVPVITSLVGHVSEIVEDGNTGLICASRTPREYVQLLDRLMCSPGLRKRLADRALDFVGRERADSVVIPRIDFTTLYKGAVERFTHRNPLEKAIRVVPSACLYARSLARPLLVRAGASS